MKTTNIEIEAKFLVPDEATFEQLQQLTAVGEFELKPKGTKKITDRYVDTPERHLFQAKFAGRLRLKGETQIFTLKSLTPAEGQLHRRQELESVIPSDDPATWPASEAKTYLLDIIGSASLQPLFTVKQTRHQFEVWQHDHPIIELSLDEVSLLSQPAKDYFELEAELLATGQETDLLQFINHLQAEWPLVPESRSKFELALDAVS